MTEAMALPFMTGLLGGFGHCAGMCGPLVSAYALGGPCPGERPGIKNIGPHVLYNLGRITTYAFIGAIMGLSGSFAASAGTLEGLQYAVSILAGAFMVVMGLGIVGLMGTGIAKAVERQSGLVLRAASPVIESGSVFKYYPLGLVLGFLPCGLSYSIFIGAAASGGLVEGMAYTLAFGLGTVPALLAVGMAMGYIGSRTRGWIYRAGGALVIAMGLRFIARGIASYASM